MLLAEKLLLCYKCFLDEDVNFIFLLKSDWFYTVIGDFEDSCYWCCSDSSEEASGRWFLEFFCCDDTDCLNNIEVFDYLFLDKDFWVLSNDRFKSYVESSFDFWEIFTMGYLGLS